MRCRAGTRHKLGETGRGGTESFDQRKINKMNVASKSRKGEREGFKKCSVRLQVMEGCVSQAKSSRVEHP